MFKFSIKLVFFFLISFNLQSQENENSKSIDSLEFEEKYGLRFGIDLNKFGRTFFDSNYSGLEMNADYRLKKRIYLAGEIGFEDKLSTTDFLISSSAGSYFKTGIDLNLYKNLLGMENLIFSGLRAGVSSFNQKRHQYIIYDTNNQTWGQIQNNEMVEFSGLSATWVELLFGVKTELFNNLFLSYNVQLKLRLTEVSPRNFDNIHIPGFGRTYDGSKIGTGFSYTISYLVPVYKKKIKKDSKSKDEINEISN